MWQSLSGVFQTRRKKNQHSMNARAPSIDWCHSQASPPLPAIRLNSCNFTWARIHLIHPAAGVTFRFF